MFNTARATQINQNWLLNIYAGNILVAQNVKYQLDLPQ